MKKILITYGLIPIVAMLMLASCVPGKKLVYLQPEGGIKQEVPFDSITASYTLKLERYRLKPEDIISLRVASVTADEYNFIKKYETDLGLIRKLNQYDQAQTQGGQGANQMQGGGGVGNMGNNSGEDGVNTGPAAIVLDRFNTGFVLDLNGALQLPQIGTVDLAGLTIPEAEHKVTELLQGYYETPMVRIQLLNYHFTIFGEVESEGRYTSFDPEITIFDAIAMAENLTEFADRSNIKLVRNTNGESKVIYLNLLDEKTLAAENLYLQRGDMIIVPPLKARTTNRYTLPIANSTLGIVSGALSLMALIITLSR